MTSLLLLLACQSVQQGTYTVCDLELSPAPAQANPGDTVVITGGPLSADFDVYVSIAGLRAEVQGIERTECEACDTCLIENDCLACGTCIPCTDTCETCVETTTVVVPVDAPRGPTRLTMVNVFGTGVTPFHVGGRDTGETGDTASPALTADTATSPPPAPTGDTATAPPDPTGSTADTAIPADTALQSTGDTATSATADTNASTGHTGTP